MIDFESGRLKAVYTPLGKDANGNLRYYRENYDQLEWVSAIGGRTATYAVPLGFERATVDPDYQLLEQEVGREFGYYTLENIVADRHEHDGSDSFVGLQFFGPV